MTSIYPWIAVYLIILMLPALYRLLKGPTIFDRIIAAGLMGTNGVLVLCIVGFAYDRIDMFVDMSIAYALINFIGTIAIGKYFEKHGREAK
jgi:multicomponent Na+:H+ antiporter subunit F